MRVGPVGNIGAKLDATGSFNQVHPTIAVAVLTGFLVCQLALFMTTVFLHRTLSHKAVKLKPGLTMTLRALLWITTGIRPREWVAVHRKHHAYTDVDGDPHSPVLEGYWKIQLGNVFYYRQAASTKELVQRYAKDLPADKWDRWLFDRPFLGLFIGVAILVAALGWQMALVAAAVHTVAYLLLNSAVNAIGHTFGSRPYPNIATNNQWLAWLVAGEGLHNNHHAAPTSAKLSFKRGEIDPGWWVIKFCAWRGWAEVRHSEVRMRKARAAA